MKVKSITKTLHILFACLWLGAASSVILLQCARGWSGNHQELAALNQIFALMDYALIIPGAAGSLMTGFWICKTTSWGFTRFWWVISKWICTFSGILIGTALLGPWQMQLVKLSRQMANALGANPSYELIRVLFTLVSFLQVLLLIIIVAVSVRKPWGKRLVSQNEARKVEQRTFSTS